MLRRFVWFVLAALVVTVTGLTAPAYSQDYDRALEPRPEPPAAEDGRRILHISDEINGTPAAQKALRAMQNAQREGMLPLRAYRMANYAVGDTASFNILVDYFADPQWISKDFVLQGQTSVARVWVEQSQLDSTYVTDEDISGLNTALLDQTGSTSYDPEKGIIANNEAIFGSPPNYDGDGVVDVLLYDIREGADVCCVLGFVAFVDISPEAEPGEGNQADVLHLDTRPGLSGFPLEELLATAAHEYQHLIHFNHDADELIFVNEGLSVWAAVLNGYESREMEYLSHPSEHNVQLLAWNTFSPFYDYQRAGLFTTYIAEQIGPVLTGAVTRAAQDGPSGYKAVLDPAGFDLSTFLGDFHAANFINNRLLGEHLGYETAQFVDVSAVPTISYDGRYARETTGSGFVRQGAVQYLSWTSVEDFKLYADVDGSTVLRERLHPRVQLERVDGTEEVAPFALGDTTTYEGTFDRVTLIVPHTKLQNLKAPFTYDASWTNDEPLDRKVVTYDDGRVATERSTAEVYNFGSEGLMANVFEAPEGYRLDKISVAPYYLSQFSGTDVPSQAPRDFKLFLWAPDTAGLPGEQLYAQEINDGRTGAFTFDLGFMDVQLPAANPIFSNLPDTFFVGVGNTGSDENHVVAALSVADSSVSYLNLPHFAADSTGAWAPFSAVESGDGRPIFDDRVLPIRATFLRSAPTAASPPENVPDRLTLSNYPNPMGTATTIHYELPSAGRVTLEVYDVLGRRIITLLENDMRSAGAHDIVLNASNWSAGVYFYTLTTGGRQYTGRITRLR